MPIGITAGIQSRFYQQEINKMPLLNYTTKVDADKTAQEIAKILSLHGAKSVLTDYEDGIVSAISFKISLNGNDISFRLPCDWRPVLEVLNGQLPELKTWHRNYEHLLSERRLQAVRTAWRIVKDWTEAQMALVETQMVSTTQVFLPYAVGKDGKTLFEKVVQNPGFLLGDGK